MAEGDERGSGRLYLEDFHVGQRFTSATHRMDTEEIKAFARQFDPQPFHLDEAAAKRSIFGGLVASGWHTAAVSMRLQVESGLPVAGGMIGIGGEMSWPQPTRPGDVLRVVSEIKEATPSRSRPDRGTVRVRSETRNQRDEVVQILDAKLLVPAAAGRPRAEAHSFAETAVQPAGDEAFIRTLTPGLYFDIR